MSEISPQELLSVFFKNIREKNTHPTCPCLRTFVLVSSSARMLPPRISLQLFLSFFMALIRCDLLRPPYLN